MCTCVNLFTAIFFIANFLLFSIAAIQMRYDKLRINQWRMTIFNEQGYIQVQSPHIPVMCLVESWRWQTNLKTSAYVYTYMVYALKLCVYFIIVYQNIYISVYYLYVWVLRLYIQYNGTHTKSIEKLLISVFIWSNNWKYKKWLIELTSALHLANIKVWQ